MSAAPDDPWAVAEASGAAILDDLRCYLARFVAYPSEHALTAHVLWIAHCWAMDAFESTPRIAFLSPEPASGKSRALEVTEPCVPRAVEAVNVTPAYLFRKVGDPAGRPTILYDEIDTVFGPKARDNEEIRGLLNAGHRRGAVAGRCVVKGRTVETEEIPAYCAVALAGLGDLPDTILTRSVVIRMRRRAPGEKVEPYRRREHAGDGHQLAERLAAWLGPLVEDLRDAWPDLPAGVTDRPADVWEPLLAIADAAGGEWPQRARVAAVALVADSMGSVPSLGVRLLADVRCVFEQSHSYVMSTEELLVGLHKLDESPWADLRGRPLDARGLAQRLRKYEVRSKNVRIGEAVVKGYDQGDFADAWERYVSSPPMESATSATSATAAPEGWSDDDPTELLSSPPMESATSATSATAPAAEPALWAGLWTGPGLPDDQPPPPPPTPCRSCGGPVEPLRVHAGFPDCVACYRAAAR